MKDIPKFIKVDTPYPKGMVCHLMDTGVTNYDFDIQISSNFIEFLSLSLVKYYHAESSRFLSSTELLNDLLQTAEYNPILSSYVEVRDFAPFLADIVVTSLVNETSIELVDNIELNKACKLMMIAFIAYGIYNRKAIKTVSKWSKSDIYDLQEIADAHLKILKITANFYLSFNLIEDYSIIQIPKELRLGKPLVNFSLIISDDCLLFINDELKGVEYRASILTKLENKGLYKSHEIMSALYVYSSEAEE